MRNVSIVNGLVSLVLFAIASACGSSNDTQNTGAGATGGATGTPTATGGNAATGGSAAATGGTTPSATGGAPSATGGAIPTGGSSAAATGGTSATGGSSSGTTTCPEFTDTAPTTYCSPQDTNIPVNAICTGALGCVAGGITIQGSSTGLTISGAISSSAPIFQGSPYTNGDCATGGISATDTTTGMAFTGMAVSLINNGTAPVAVNIILPDIASATSSTSLYSVTMTATAVVQPSPTATTVTMHWSDFTPNCTLGNVSFDPTQILALGLSVGDASTTYPVTVDITIASLSFTTT